MNRICLYFKQQPEQDRWLPGDRFVRPSIRRVIRGKLKFVGGVDRIFLNLCEGLNRLGVAYELNIPFAKLRDDDMVGVVGRGKYALHGYKAPNPIVAGPWLMSHPILWPDLCEQYPIVRYLHHCDWCTEMFKPYFGDRCITWAHGVDTLKWAPSTEPKDFDVLLYDKIRWERERLVPQFIQPIREALLRRGLKVAEIHYGHYTEAEYRNLLARSRSMLFLVEHEAQGHACQECLSSDVPVLAWNPGWWRDPDRFMYDKPEITASSVPHLDERCIETFLGLSDFEIKLDLFMKRVREGSFSPREFITDNLSLDNCASNYIKILQQVASDRK